MNTIKVQPNQSFADLVIMACGTMEGGMQIMAANNQSISDAATTGQPIMYDPAIVTTDTGALQYLQQTGIVIGTS